jgi:hypothetical protein
LLLIFSFHHFWFWSLPFFLWIFFLLHQRLDLRGHKVRSLNASGLNLAQNLEVNMYYPDVLVLIYAKLVNRECLTDTFVWQFVYLRDNLLSTLEGIEILKRVKVCFVFHHDSISYYNSTWPFFTVNNFWIRKIQNVLEFCFMHVHFQTKEA